jgi:hypothetical protein
MFFIGDPFLPGAITVEIPLWTFIETKRVIFCHNEGVADKNPFEIVLIRHVKL